MEQFDKNKYNKDEQIDYELFSTFNNRTKHKRLFCPTNPASKYDIFSIKLESKTEEVIELKLRDKKYLEGDDIFIEPWKYDNLMEYWKKGYLPIYINFFGDADDVWLWILPEVDITKCQTYEK